MQFCGFDVRLLSEEKSSTRLSKLRKQIEMIGIEIKDLNEQTETERLIEN